MLLLDFARVSLSPSLFFSRPRSVKIHHPASSPLATASKTLARFRKEEEGRKALVRKRRLLPKNETKKGMPPPPVPSPSF